MTAKQLEQAVLVAATVYQIVAAHTGGIPSGHVYALTMPCFDNVDAYERCIGMLVNSRLIRRDGLILHANPTAPAAI